MTALPLEMLANAPSAVPSGQVSRLLVGVTPGQRVTWRAHRMLHGPMPAEHASTALLDVLAHSGLRGRGGAGFPTAKKWQSVADHHLRPVIVGNGAEGEPACAKDRCLLRHNPHLVIDGAQLAGAALEATRVVLWVHAGGEATVAAVRAAVAERTGDPLPTEVVVAPEHFLSGEKSAVVRGVNGGPAVPTGGRASVWGVDARPTLVQNVETLAHVALLARYGVDWFRSVGTAEEPGSMLTTVFGAVAAPGVHEVAVGAALADVIAQAGGLRETASAYLLGGYHGSWVPADATDLPMTHTGMRAAGASLGAGLVVALPENTCGIHESARVMRYLADATAGQCGPCKFGLPAIASAVEDLAYGRATGETAAMIERWMGQVRRRGGCGHPDGALRFLHSALDLFAHDVEAHLAGTACPPPSAPLLPTRHEVIQR